MAATDRVQGLFRANIQRAGPRMDAWGEFSGACREMAGLVDCYNDYCCGGVGVPFCQRHANAPANTSANFDACSSANFDACSSADSCACGG